MTNYVRARSLAFVDVAGEAKQLSVVIEIKQPIVADAGAAHLFIELTPGQVALLLRECAISTTKVVVQEHGGI